jgi:peptidoglycan/LPS O-acetylase OafA/YrhL
MSGQETSESSALCATVWWQSMDAKLAREIPSLYGIRAVAVFLVIIYHFGFDNVNGALGVEMFFTLSGFLITWLLLKESDATGTISLRNFYLRRTLRIFPAMYVYLLLGLAIYLVRGHSVPWADVAASALYLQNYHAAIFHTEDSYLSHTWSLAIEEQFYLLWPLVICQLRNNLCRLTTVLVTVIAGAWILRGILYFGLGIYQGYIYHAFETRMDQLAMGCLLAVLLKRKVLQTFWLFVTSRIYLPAIAILIIGASSMLHWSFDYRYAIGYTLEPLFTAILLVQLIVLSETMPWKFFNGALMTFLGRISYSLYLYQQLTLYTATRLTAEYPVPIQLAFAIVVTVAFATISYYLVEQLFRSKVAASK